MFICFQTQPERRRLEPKLNFRRLSSSRRVPGYLFCDAQRPKAICSVQVQVGLSPVDNLLQAFPFGVTFGNSREQKNGCMDVCVAPVATAFALWTLVIIWILQGFKETCVRIKERNLKPTKTIRFTSKNPFLAWILFGSSSCSSVSLAQKPGHHLGRGTRAKQTGPNRSPDSQHSGRLSCDSTDSMTAWRAPPLWLAMPNAFLLKTHLGRSWLDKLLPPLSSQTLYTEIPGFKTFPATQAARLHRLNRVHT